ncbi:MAG: glycosyltransferase family 9 protein [Actinobacteria bacterium]|nr:glycosyltransferase family 9 protein [Actinomycetota bacterium]
MPRRHRPDPQERQSRRPRSSRPRCRPRPLAGLGTAPTAGSWSIRRPRAVRCVDRGTQARLTRRGPRRAACWPSVQREAAVDLFVAYAYQDDDYAGGLEETFSAQGLVVGEPLALWPGQQLLPEIDRRLHEAGVPADPDDFLLAAPGREAPPEAHGATVVHPGASTGARRWPAERWAAVATAEVAAGRPVVVTGSAVERPLAEEVAASAGVPAGSVLAGRTDLLDLLAVVDAAERVVCGDTGVAHVATALAVPSVVIFGPTSPAEWGPPASGPHRALWAGHTGDALAEEPFPGLLDVSVTDVVAALADLPQRCRS